MSSIEAVFAKLQALMGPTVFGSIMSSLSMIILRGMPPKEALVTALSGMFLAVVFAPPLAQWTSAQFGVELQSALAMWGGFIALLGRDGLISIISKWINKK